MRKWLVVLSAMTPAPFLVLAYFAIFSTIPALAQDQPSGPIVVHELKHDVSAPLRDIAIPARPSTSTPLQAPLARPTGPMLTSSEPDSVAQTPSSSSTAITTLLNFDGQSADNIAPPDTNGAVGASQFVQWVNLEYNIYNKTTGAKILGPIKGNSFWSGFGGPCESRNDGDPIIQYDKAENRWVAAQPVFAAPYMYCMAVSTTLDATGSYNRYAFSFGDINFPDYPKLGVWPDAYYASFNIFENGKKFIGAQACAFDRTNMLTDNPAEMVCFPPAPNIASLLPSDLDGSTPPPTDEPDFFVGLADSSHLNLFRFHVDFITPSNSAFTGPTLIPVAAFSEICNRSTTTACIPEPRPGGKVDALSDRLMYRLAYRNFGDHESLVVNHTVAGGPLAGVRWYEIRSPDSAPFVFQQGTVVDPTINFWMGSIAMDKAGDIALGFSASSTTLDPSVMLAGRVPDDPLGTMETTAAPLVTGTGAQQGTFHRWGDYSSMGVDPDDDCTLWYTQEYYKTTGSFNWSTRITSFKFRSCP
jgi:hypothetical protein